MRPPISFLIPRQHWPPGGLTQTVEALWPWLVSRGKRGVGPWVWTLQTYLHLRTSGVGGELADALPRKGIVVSHRDFLPEERTAECFPSFHAGSHPGMGYESLPLGDASKRRVWSTLFVPWPNW